MNSSATLNPTAGTDSPAMDCVHRTCPICGMDNATQQASPFSQEPWLLKSCASCSFLYLENAPVYERLASEFAWEKTSEQVTEKRGESTAAKVTTELKETRKKIQSKRNKVRDLILKHMPHSENEPSILLDVGCAKGSMLQAITWVLQEKNYEMTPIGIEISEDLHAISDKKMRKLGGEVIFADALSGLESLQPNSINAAIMHSYLEHEINPNEVLAATQSALKSKGVVVIKVPNFSTLNRVVTGKKWCGFRYPDHVNYFTPESLEKIAHKAGLKVLQMNWLDHHPVSDNMYAVLQKA